MKSIECMIKKHGLFLLMLLVIADLAIAQPSQTQAFLPKIVPATPEAGGIAKYGNYQVNMYTGVPDISIPLYQLQVGELSVPISISYHASGIKVSDIASNVGLGWSLFAGGIISRKIMGRPDEQPGNYLSGATVKTVAQINTLVQADLDYLRSASQGNSDVEPDIFSYSYPGGSGKFVFNQQNNFKPILMPYSPALITRNGYLFDITDERGVVHKYGTWEQTVTNSSNAPSSWMLTQMISSNQKDTINFSYIAGPNGTTDVTNTDFIVLNDFVDNTPYGNYTSDGGASFTSSSFASTTWQQRNEILFKNGKVVFELGTDARQDFNISLTTQKRLNAIKIYNFDIVSSTYKIIRIIQFYHSYFIKAADANTKRLRLDSITVASSTGAAIETYRFDYNNTVTLPIKDSRAKDYWGYYNNIDNNSLVPRMSVTYQSQINSAPTTIWVGSSFTNGREPDPNYTQACMLNKITYPTGGYSDFLYETNQYIDAQSVVKYGGGLRIKKISNYDGITATPIVKTYKYGQNETGYGRRNFFLNNYFFQNEQTNRFIDIPPGYLTPIVVSTKRTRTFLSNPTIDIEPYDGATVAYAYVTEYIGDETTNSGKTIYQFTDQGDAMSWLTGFGKPSLTSYHFNRGQLLNKSVYRKDAGPAYRIVSSSANTYGGFAEQFTANLGLAVFKHQINQTSNGVDDYPLEPAGSGNLGQDDSYSYRFANYSIRTGDNKLTSTTETAYDQNDVSKILTSTTNYYYDNINHHQLTRVETINSKGETILTTKKYPHDYSTTAPYSNMIAKNIINRVVEEKVTNNGTTLSILNNYFFDWGNTNYLPSYINLQVAANTPETRAQFTKYNTRGSIQEMNKADDAKMVYIWDYQSLYPVAEVVNATEAEVAYSSFESDGKGNWTFTGNVLNDPSAITGNRSYDLTNGSISKTTGLSAASLYTVSYWTKNASAFSITGTQAGFPIAGPIVNGWRFFQHKIAGVTSVTLSGTGFIDELRLYPSKAQMSTSTYEPLIGATARVDANNRISYYEYDAAGRLKTIRDQNRNVRKVFCYNYSGQAIDCNGIFKNTVYAQNFTRNNCGSGFTGSSVTYTVPASVYTSTVSQADADAKALADALLNGQSYANINGTCTPTVTMITINGYNAKASNYNVKFTNTSTATSYTFLLPANTFTPTYKGQVPAGTYNVQFYPQGASVTATFNINGFTFFGFGGTTFNGISVNATSTASMY